MKIVVTGSGGRPGSLIARHLDKSHTVSGVDGTSDLRDPEVVRPILDGTEMLVHAGALTDLPEDLVNDDAGILDWSARGTYVLMDEACNHGVRRVVLVSSLDLLDDYPDSYVIDETWRPRPRPEAASLAPLMAERTCREFSRQRSIESICLRIGEVDTLGGTPEELLLNAVQRAVEMEVEPGSYRSWLFHVSDRERYPLRAAKGKPLSLGETG
jgi:nucleoside-diphosphate-sugar epimerase